MCLWSQWPSSKLSVRYCSWHSIHTKCSFHGATSLLILLFCHRVIFNLRFRHGKLRSLGPVTVLVAMLWLALLVSFQEMKQGKKDICSSRLLELSHVCLWVNNNNNYYFTYPERNPLVALCLPSIGWLSWDNKYFQGFPDL